MTVAPASTATPSVAAYHPLLGVAAVVVGAFISTINTRVTTVGLADIRGGLSLGFDEASWLSTAFGASQMVVCLSAAWFSIVLGPRRVLLWSSAIFLISSILPPLTRDPSLQLVLQIVRGLAVGTFIPSAIGFILRELPPRWWSWGLAAYAFRFAFSQNISSSIEAFYDENGLWEWIFWQNIPLTLLMMGLICLGMRREPPDLAGLRRADWSGIMFAGVGLALLYAGIDQGNRLDWLNSGTIIGLLLALSVWSVAVAVERWLFYRHIDLGRFSSQQILEIALTKRLVIIGTVAANAPYIGLLGTVLGIMLTFHTMGTSGTMAVNTIMIGLSLALKATAVGLLVAIPCVVMNNVLRRRVAELVAQYKVMHGSRA